MICNCSSFGEQMFVPGARSTSSSYSTLISRGQRRARIASSSTSNFAKDFTRWNKTVSKSIYCCRYTTPLPFIKIDIRL